MTGVEKRSVTRGCIKATKGPWVIRKTTKNGDVVIKLRHPSERERQKNKQRERTRRAVAKNIFAGLRAHGNFSLPKHADNNDLLKALCEHAGRHVDEDGNIYKKDATFTEPISNAKLTPGWKTKRRINSGSDKKGNETRAKLSIIRN